MDKNDVLKEFLSKEAYSPLQSFNTYAEASFDNIESMVRSLQELMNNYFDTSTSHHLSKKFNFMCLDTRHCWRWLTNSLKNVLDECFPFETPNYYILDLWGQWNDSNDYNTVISGPLEIEIEQPQEQGATSTIKVKYNGIELQEEQVQYISGTLEVYLWKSAIK